MTAVRAYMGYCGLWHTLSPQFSVVGNMDATGEKLAQCGYFWHPDGPGSYDISRVHFRWGDIITKAGGSALTLSLQDVNAAAGPPMQPDEVQDQTVAISNTDIGAANTWFRSGTLSSNRTVTTGSPLAMVLEFDGSGRLGSDLIRLGVIAGYHPYTSTALVKTASWSASNFVVPIAVFECTDGSFGTFRCGVSGAPFSALTRTAFNSGSAADERALAFMPDVTMTIDAVSGFFGATTSTADFDLVIYDGTTPVHTQSIDANQLKFNDNGWHDYPLSTSVTLSAGVQYYIALKPTTANNCLWYTGTVYSAGFMPLIGLPASSGEATRVDGGSWSAISSTNAPLIGLHITDITVGGGSAKPHHPFSQKVIL